MVKEDVVHMYNEDYSPIKKKWWNYVVCKKINGTGDNGVRQDKPRSERQIYMFLFICEI